MPENFEGLVQRWFFNFSTTQNFLKNRLNINLDMGLGYTDNSDFSEKNKLALDKYVTNFGGNMNVSYSNLFKKNININGWFALYTQNYGNNIGNKAMFYHNISITKLFPKTEMEATMRLNNFLWRPNSDQTTFTPIGTFRSASRTNWYGITLSFVKRFGNQKVKENSKTNVEKDSGGGKS